METCRPCQNWSSAKHCPPSDCLSEPSVTSAERVRKLPSRSPLSGLFQQTMEQSRAPQRERQRATKGVFPITHSPNVVRVNRLRQNLLENPPPFLFFLLHTHNEKEQHVVSTAVAMGPHFELQDEKAARAQAVPQF